MTTSRDVLTMHKTLNTIVFFLFFFSCLYRRPCFFDVRLTHASFYFIILYDFHKIFMRLCAYRPYNI